MTQYLFRVRSSPRATAKTVLRALGRRRTAFATASAKEVRAMAWSYDESYQKGINDKNSGLPPSPPPGPPPIPEVYQIGRNKAGEKAT